MSLFPWQDWFYHISQKETDLNTEYNTYINLCQTISANGAKLNNDVNTVNSMYLRNYALLIVLTQTMMKQSDYAQWLKDSHALKPANPKNSMAIEVMQGCADLVGLAAFGKLVWNLGSAAKNAIWSSSSEELGTETLEGGESVADALTEPLLGEEGLAEVSDLGLDEVGEIASESIGEAAGEAGAELGTEAAIEATGEAVAEASISAVSVATAGLAIVAAVGIDAILGAIQGAKESEQLAKEKKKLDAALRVTTKFSGKVNSQTTKTLGLILKQQSLFEKNMELLNKIQGASFKYHYDATSLSESPHFTTAMANAVAEYGWLPTIRTDWDNYTGNDYSGWTNFEMMMKMMKPKTMSTQVADGFLGYAKNKLIVPAS